MLPEYRVPLKLLGTEQEDLAPQVYGAVANPFTSSVVLFGIHRGKHIAIKFWQLSHGAEHEWEGLTKASDAGIKTTPPVGLAMTEEGKTVLISSKIAGTNLYTNPDLLLRRRFGEIVRTMHDDVYVEGTSWRQSEYSDFERIASKLQLRLESVGTDTLRSEAASLIGNNSEALRGRLVEMEPSFTHNDLHNDQVLVLKDGTMALIDFESWSEGDPLKDIAKYIFHTLRTRQPITDITEFARGYSKITGDLSTDDVASLSYYVLEVGINTVSFYRRFRHSHYHWALDYLNRIVEYLESGEILNSLKY